jgi:signal transduction histidine kinase
VDLVAYRLLEEALTNALKHGTGAARIEVEYGDSSLQLRVLNPVPAGTAQREVRGTDGSGHGLIGMRERAAAVGAMLDVGLASGNVFTVVATLPLQGGRT